MAYGLYVISPGTGLSCPRRLRDHQLANLASASGGQDHTISPSAPASLVQRSRHVHRIPPHDRDDAFAPLAEAGRVDNASDLGSASNQFLKNETRALRQTGTTGNLRMSRMRNLLVGQRASCAGSVRLISAAGMGTATCIISSSRVSPDTRHAWRRKTPDSQVGSSASVARPYRHFRSTPQKPTPDDCRSSSVWR